MFRVHTPETAPDASKPTLREARENYVKMQELFDDATLEALRAQESLPDDRLEALRAFTAEVVRERGWVEQGALQTFVDAGYEPRHVLAVVTVVAMKTLSNYTNHIADTPLDEAFADHRWSKEVVPA